MDKGAAIYSFFSGFGIPAYASSSVPSEAKFPYITYDLVTGDFQNEVSMTASVWYYTSSEAEPDRKAEEISLAIGYGGKMILCDGGSIWIRRANPWCQSMAGDPSNTMVKRRVLNLAVEYITAF